MIGSAWVPVLLGLTAAVFWGVGDFSGGLASRRSNAYRVVLTSEWSGLVVLLPLPFIFSEPFPPVSTLLISGVASLCGTAGIVMLYQSLAGGQMSIAAPVSALLAAVIPVVVSAFTEGLPNLLKMIGFILALASIWLVSSNAETKTSLLLRWSVVRLPFLAGITFGAYFVLMNFAGQHATFWPLVSARVVGGLGVAVALLVMRMPPKLPRAAFPLAVLTGVLDVTANGFFLVAGQTGRLDMAAVLGSLYPAMTVLLAGLVLKERLGRAQVAGIAVALAAIVLIAR